MHLPIVLLLLGAVASPAWAQPALPTPPSLPKRVYALSGQPCIIRFDSIIYAPQPGSLLFDVESGPGAQQVGRWIWYVKATDTPAPLEIGVYSAQFEKLATLRSELIKCDPAAITPPRRVRWLPVGDSLTLPGHYLTQTLAYFQAHLPGVTLETVGTTHPKDQPTPPHEGRGGWSWLRYQRDAQSPFVFASGNGSQIDFGRYLKERLNGEVPDIITFFLGANDVYGIAAAYTPEKLAALQERAQNVVAHIRQAAPKSAIGIVIPPPPSDQNAFGNNYPVGVTEWQYRRAMQHYSAALIAAFDGQWEQNLYIIPAHLGFDPASAYPMAGNRAQNALHPTAKGFEPVSEAISAWIVHLLSSGALAPQ